MSGDKRSVENLKQVTTDIEEHLVGVTDALLAEIHDDERLTSINCTWVVNRTRFHPPLSGRPTKLRK